MLGRCLKISISRWAKWRRYLRKAHLHKIYPEDAIVLPSKGNNLKKRKDTNIEFKSKDINTKANEENNSLNEIIQNLSARQWQKDETWNGRQMVPWPQKVCADAFWCWNSSHQLTRGWMECVQVLRQWNGPLGTAALTMMPRIIMQNGVSARRRAL